MLRTEKFLAIKKKLEACAFLIHVFQRHIYQVDNVRQVNELNTRVAMQNTDHIARLGTGAVLLHSTAKGSGAFVAQSLKEIKNAL
jgi:hypothetical protein